MDTIGLMDIIMDKGSPDRDRIEAIKQLGVIRSQEKEQLRRGGMHLSVLSGQETLQRVVQRRREQVEVRCQAAAVAAKTDSKSTLVWCNQMIRRYC